MIRPPSVRSWTLAGAFLGSPDARQAADAVVRDSAKHCVEERVGIVWRPRRKRHNR